MLRRSLFLRGGVGDRGDGSVDNCLHRASGEVTTICVGAGAKVDGDGAKVDINGSKVDL